MKLRLVLNMIGAAFLVFGCASCVPFDYPYWGGGGSYYGGSYGSSYRGPYGGYHGGSYTYRSPFAGPHGAFHGGAAAGYGHHYRDHYDKEDRIKLTAGSQKGKGTRPSEYHDREWFEKRGYDLSKYKHKHEHNGKTHEGKNYKKKR